MARPVQLSMAVDMDLALAFSEAAETLWGAELGTQRHTLVPARDRPAERPPRASGTVWCLDGGSADGACSFQQAMSTSTLNAGGTDLELMERIRAGDDRALGELYDRHGAVMYSLARSIVSEPADAEEVVADAFLQIWRGAPQYDRGRASVGAFLAVVTRSRALDALPESQREVILLAYFGGYSQTEIAARLSEPLGTVKTRVRTGMQKLREALSPHAPEVES